MGAEQSLQPKYETSMSEMARSGNYAAQRQLDYRLTDENTLSIISPSSTSADEERDFQIAMKRRQEPAGASLAEIGKKFGL
jgi:hypothetical protein